METITIPKQEYEKLKETAAKVEMIDEVLHQPELSDEIKEELARARAVPDAELLNHQEIKRKFGVV